MLPTDKKTRKEMPIFRGVLRYFPDAIAAVANVSFVGNQQHNPGQELHWAKNKSTDHGDCIARHLIDAGTVDDDGVRHSAKLAWRALALLQIELEAEQAKPRNFLAEAIEEAIDAQDKVIREGAFGPVQVSEALTTEDFDRMFGIPYSGRPFPVGNGVDDGIDPNTPLIHTETVETWHGIPILDPKTEPFYVSRKGVEDDYEYTEARKLAAEDAIAEYPPKDEKDSQLEDLLRETIVDPKIGLQIIGGATFNSNSAGTYCYIAGPMRGYPQFNFPAFDKARDLMYTRGWNVISPADIDRAAGDQNSDNQCAFAYRDFLSLWLIAKIGGGAVAFLPGWESSTGATAEFFLARWLGLKILDARDGAPLTPLVLQEEKLIGKVAEFLHNQLTENH